MTDAPKKAAAKKKTAAKAAVAEKGDGGKPPVEWRGITLTLPDGLANLPAEFAWAVAELETATGQSVTPLLNLLRALIGPEQETTVRGKLIEDGVTFAELPDALTELLTVIFGEYGLTLGESPASPQS